MIQGRLKEKRKQGRPRTSYFQNIRTWTGLSIREIYDTTQRRDDWKDVTLRAMWAANTDGDAGQ